MFRLWRAGRQSKTLTDIPVVAADSCLLAAGGEDRFVRCHMATRVG